VVFNPIYHLALTYLINFQPFLMIRNFLFVIIIIEKIEKINKERRMSE
jgi:hypothetical protein